MKGIQQMRKPYFRVYDSSVARPAVEVLCKYNIADLPDGKIPRYVMECPDLSISAKGVYAVLCFLAPAADHLPGAKGLAEICHVGSETLRKYREELINKRFLALGCSPPFCNGYRHYVLPQRRGGIDLGCKGYGAASGAVLADQTLNIKQKGLYAYLQSLGPNEPPAVNDVAATLGVQAMYIYQNYYELANFCPNIPDRWRNRALANLKTK